MSRAEELLGEAHRVASRAGYRHVLACVQQKASRRTLTEVATEYRRAADLVDEVAALLPDKHSRGN